MKITHCARIAQLTDRDDRSRGDDDSRMAYAMRSVQHLLGTISPRESPNGPDKGRQGTSFISDEWGVRTEPRRRSVGQEPSAYMIWD